MFSFGKKRQKGFTLLEFTITFAASAGVLAGVWVAADSVIQSSKQQKANEQVLTVVQNVRDFYGPRTASLPELTRKDFMKKLVENKLVPQEMVKADGSVGDPLFEHALGDSFTAEPTNCTAGKCSAMRLAVGGLTEQKCTKFILNMPLLSTQMGIVKIKTSSHEEASITPTKVGGSQEATLPTTLATVKDWCASQDRVNEVQLDFSLRN